MINNPEPTNFVIPDVDRINDAEDPISGGNLDRLTREWLATESARTLQWLEENRPVSYSEPLADSHDADGA